MKEFISAVEEIENEDSEEEYAEFKLDGRVIRAYNPTPGQLIFLLAVMGRGQSDESRFAGMINVMMESFRGADKDHMEGRLLTRDKKRRLEPKKVEEIFEHLTEQWFATPTQPPSDSAPSLPTSGEK